MSSFVLFFFEEEGEEDVNMEEGEEDVNMEEVDQTQAKGLTIE